MTMKIVDPKFVEPAGCTQWFDESEQNLADASFLTIEPHGEVSFALHDGHSAIVEVVCADGWCIIAHFPQAPGCVAVSFELKDRDLVFATLFEVKGSRPIFYCTPTVTIEIEGETVEELVSVVRLFDESVDKLDWEANHPWLMVHGEQHAGTIGEAEDAATSTASRRINDDCFVPGSENFADDYLLLDDTIVLDDGTIVLLDPPMIEASNGKN